MVDSETNFSQSWGDYKNAVASRKRRSIRFWEGNDGALEYAVDIPNTPAGRVLKETLDAKAVNVVGRPVIDTNASDFAIKGTVAEYDAVKVRALTVGATDRDGGWPAVYLREDADDDMPTQRAREDVTLDPHRGGCACGFRSLESVSQHQHDGAATGRDRLHQGEHRRRGRASPMTARRRSARTASELIERFAPDAPQSVRNEATIRRCRLDARARAEAAPRRDDRRNAARFPRAILLSDALRTPAHGPC